ncbi:MAG: hypothetical protein ACOYEA_03545 [Fermentimonas sp.]
MLSIILMVACGKDDEMTVEGEKLESLEGTEWVGEARNQYTNEMMPIAVKINNQRFSFFLMNEALEGGYTYDPKSGKGVFKSFGSMDYNFVVSEKDLILDFEGVKLNFKRKK